MRMLVWFPSRPAVPLASVPTGTLSVRTPALDLQPAASFLFSLHCFSGKVQATDEIQKGNISMTNLSIVAAKHPNEFGMKQVELPNSATGLIACIETTTGDLEENLPAKCNLVIPSKHLSTCLDCESLVDVPVEEPLLCEVASSSCVPYSFGGVKC